MTAWQLLIDQHSPLVTVALVLGVAVALNVRDWAMRNRVEFREYPAAFLLVAWMTIFYLLIQLLYLLFPDIPPFVRMTTNRVVFWLFLVGLIHSCRGPLEWFWKYLLMGFHRRLHRKGGIRKT